MVSTSAYTAQKMKFSIEDFFSKCNRIRSKLRIWSHLQEKSLIENFSFVKWCFLGSFSEIAESFISEKKLLLNRKDGIPRNITQHVFFTISCN